MTMLRALIWRCLPVVLLLGISGGMLLAQSSISGTLYENTVAVDTVLIAAGSNTIANAGGIYLDHSIVRGNVSATTVSEGNLAVAVGGGASSRLGGVTLKNAD